MMLRHLRRRPTREDGLAERGAALVEFAFVALFLVLLSAGSFDYGMAWRVGLVTNEAARTGARTGSALGDRPLADWYALSGARAALLNSGRLQDVQRVVVFKSATSDGRPPAQCINSNSSSQPCVVLTGDQFRGMNAGSFDATTGCFTAATIKNWCPSIRNNVQLNAEYYGVWIQTTYHHQFSLIQDTTTVSRDAVMRLEPEVS